MKHITLETKIEELTLDELSPEEQELVQRAKQATQGAYAKYSHFKVGAALRLQDGQIIMGANQENAAFPSGLCAERTAIFAAQANHPNQPVVQLAVTACNENGPLQQPVTPCGACRQVLIEVENRYGKPMEVLLCGEKTIYRLPSAHSLMPLSFHDEQLHA